MKELMLASIVSLSFVSILFPTGVFAASINCNNVPQECVGTNDADKMTATKVVLDNQNNYKAEGLKGDDNIDFDISNIVGMFVAGDDGNDKLSLKTSLTGRHGASGFGEDGDDTIVISASFGAGHGGKGADKISIRSTSESFLFQHNEINTPDGKKDVLNCNNSPNSKAYISLEDGDAAVGCEKVITTQGN
jgi:hypothetical protein